MIWPNPISGYGVMGQWLNRLRSSMRARQIVSGPGYRVKEVPGGVILEFDSRGGGTPELCPPTEFAVSRFVNNYGVTETMPEPTANDPHAQAQNNYTASGGVTLGAPIPMGFKAVQAKKAWHGRFGFLNPEHCAGVSDPPQTKYRRVDRLASWTGNCWNLGNTPASHNYAVSSRRVMEVSRDSGVVTAVSVTDPADPGIECLDFDEARRWCEGMAQTDYRCDRFSNGDADAQAIIDQYNNVPDGQIIYDGINTGFAILRSVTNTTLTWTLSYDSERDDNIPKPDPYPIAYTQSVTVVLSEPYTAENVKEDITALLGVWDLSDDAQYPWREDGYCTINPQVRRDEVQAAVNPDRWEAAGWEDSNKAHTGAVIGSPKAAGYQGYWQAQHWNYRWNGEWWEFVNYGAWLPGFLPANTTEWSSKWEASDVFWPGASYESTTWGMVYAQKWAETLLPRDAYNYTRPDSRDKYRVDETTVRCIDSISGSTVTILGTDPGWAEYDVCAVTDARYPASQGVWTIERTDATHYVLNERLEDLPGWWDLEEKAGMMGKCIWYRTERPVAPSNLSTDKPRGDFMEQIAEVEARYSLNNVACVDRNVTPDGCVPCVLFTLNSEQVDGGLTLALRTCGLDERHGALARQFPRLYVDDPFWQAPAAPCAGGDWNEDSGDGTGQYARRPYVEARCSAPAGAPALPAGIALGCMSAPCALPGRVGQAAGEVAEFEGEWVVWIRELGLVCGNPSHKFAKAYEENRVTSDYC